MKQYKLVKQGDNIILYKYNEETDNYIEVPDVTIEDLFNKIDAMLEAKNKIEKFHLVDNNQGKSCIELVTVKISNEGKYSEETKIIEIDDKLLKNKEFKLQLYNRVNLYQACLKRETQENIACARFKRARILQKTS